jgi:cytochrome c oxidase subunit 1
MPPGHGNWGAALPVVYRWAYAYSVPGAKQDFLPQNLPPDQANADEGLEHPPRVAAQPAAE